MPSITHPETLPQVYDPIERTVARSEYRRRVDGRPIRKKIAERSIDIVRGI